MQCGNPRYCYALTITVPLVLWCCAKDIRASGSCFGCQWKLGVWEGGNILGNVLRGEVKDETRVHSEECKIISASNVFLIDQCVMMMTLVVMNTVKPVIVAIMSTILFCVHDCYSIWRQGEEAKQTSTEAVHFLFCLFFQQDEIARLNSHFNAFIYQSDTAFLLTLAVLGFFASSIRQWHASMQLAWFKFPVWESVLHPKITESPYRGKWYSKHKIRISSFLAFWEYFFKL